MSDHENAMRIRYKASEPQRSDHKRYASSKPPARKSSRDDSVQNFITDTEPRSRRYATDDQRLASSDLEDCEEIWVPGLNEYITDSQRRLRQVEQWFNASMKERTSITAQRVSHYYSSKIAKIPAPPSPPAGLDDDGPARYLESNPSSSRSGNRLGNQRDVGAFAFPPGSQLSKVRGWSSGKRPASSAVSDAGSDVDTSLREGMQSTKRRRIEDDEILATRSAFSGIPNDFISDTFKPKDPALISHPPSTADITPSISRPTSPLSSVIFELDENVPPLKKAKKMDNGAIQKRVRALEDAQKKVWTNIARRDVAKVYKYHVLGFQAKQTQAERVAKLASLQARRPYTKTAKATRDVQLKAKRLMREMQVFWKKNEREERDVRKREHKEAMDRLKMEEEKREAARQARKLEFLISQTELYSHFVGSKLKTHDPEGEEEDRDIPVGADGAGIDPKNLRAIDFDEEDKTNLYMHARHNAQEAIALTKRRAQQFDEQAASERKANEALQSAKLESLGEGTQEDESLDLQPTGGQQRGPVLDLDSNELNFQNPTSLTGPLTINQPKMLMAQLKEYQLKGLNWLATLYEQGINGILADEMGLGKTVQSISLLAYLAETHDIWGPFLVVAPLSTLHNWQQEITRFAPKLKALPYWGNVKDRTTLRKFWSKKEISYNEDAPFHILITSYQLVTQDQQYFQRVKWQYMILDEAQNIKNSSSARWKTLLSFQCRNRLLLTGTPIQNSMQELWALLHFIMPSLFDSHDEFNEWFSKDIENAAAENKGSKLNEHQLRRLHMILKPFMLRRVKKHVQNELSEKIEIDIYVDLSARQRSLYKALLAKVSIADLLAKAANISDAESARSLMNLVMQFRKVCNHPELFERADVVAPFSFSVFGRSGPLIREGDFLSLPYSSRNPIELVLPELLYKEGGILSVPSEESNTIANCLLKLTNIWSTHWIHRSLCDDDEHNRSAFSFLRLLDMSPQEAHQVHVSPLIRRHLANIRLTGNLRLVPMDPAASIIQSAPGASPWQDLQSIVLSAWSQSCLSRSRLKWFVPPAIAPPISMFCPDRTFLEWQNRIQDSALDSLALYGMPLSLRDNEDAYLQYGSILPGLPPVGILGTATSYQTPTSPMQIPEAKRLIYDSGKLARFDTLLQELKAGDHRVLVYFQMTRMMDLMEEYLIYRQYKYLRLDGSSKLEDRRDMVIDWQTRPDIFVFLLSTRAGGLGINLTAADTVIFYDHDWNPSNDAQAMDRAHRLGQTRQVTVYRLITRGTIDERIVQLARVKKDVQDIVVGNKTFTDVAKPSEIVQLLLNDEQLAGLDTSATKALTSEDNHMVRTGGEERDTMRDLWNEEGDDFFRQTSLGTGEPGPEDDNGQYSTTSRPKRGGKRAGRGRGKATGKKRSGTVTETASPMGD